LNSPACYRVSLTRSARDDLAGIGRYRASLRGLGDAERLLDSILQTIATLEHFPLRGPAPKELEASGENKVRQTQRGLYRIIYEIIYEVADATVTVFLIADGRRDMQTLLAARLLAP